MINCVSFMDDPVALFMSLDDWQDDASSSSQSSSDTFLVGFVIANIVGLRYYSGTITGRELVGLVRESTNPYDHNAIRVLNTRTVQVGHIERSVASVLSPLIDSRKITVEGIVANSRSTLNKFKIPCQVHVFARIEDLDSVKTEIMRSGLVLITENDASFGLSEAMVVKENNKKTGNRSVDEIFKLVDDSVSKKGKLGTLEPPKEVIKSELFAHQKEGLWWLMNRENSDELPPFWEEKDGKFVNVLTNYQSYNRPEPLRGGILADDMGLGKTLTLLSLIAFDKVSSDKSIDRRNIKQQPCEVDEEVSLTNDNKGKRGRVKKETGGRKRRKTEDTCLDSKVQGKSVSTIDKSCSAGPTLIVCPPVVFSTWITQLEDHTEPGSLKVYIYHGERTKEADVLRKQDIVLTTYSTLVSEDSSEDSPVKMINWWRVILDEAHVIKNAIAQQSRAVTNLKAKRRWVVTGTPIQNGSLDLFSLMAFLRFEPFSIKNYWQSLVQRPLAQGDKKGLSRLQVLMATISLRRTKDKGLVGLPSKTVETCYVELSQEECEMYDQMEGEAKGVVQSFINTDSLTRNYSTVLCIILRLRQICNDPALCPSDLRALLPSNSIEDVSNNPELLEKVVALLQDGEDFDCPICISPPTDTVITRCAHVFCRPCILKTLQRVKPSCPLCRRCLTMADLFSAPPESSSTENTEISGSKSNASSKVRALLNLLIAARERNPTAKSVIFSQFQKMLVLLEEPLKAAGFKILRLDGTMSAKKKHQVIKDFGALGPIGPTVLLASLKASGAGINLTSASTVYLLEPWWNPAVEEQAMDRVHRIGQKEDVTVVRLITRNSIEERILEMQERKKKLAKEAFGKRGAKVHDVRTDDLRILMSFTNG
ncbi:putative SWI/SNF-related matrix-associated actin-dependent regulator of chromatin subfamily A member 3-like 1 [Mercurialis annua]|uniref:putative SWI/SNF-related matrix-associated actin-dependent regulator of chromatin subfamily A member 3-like 1 n=1 Tax=Mercurialis annua TaxID=3986 RepID=UPI00215E8BB1|nr:putative SWI/SNF-related matrix-associated actin-dependent regulator of chromatin subfamily A member 3-like 1 [Mercurialis annua]